MDISTIDEVRRRLNRQGRRMTPQRATVLAALRATRSHPTAEEIHREVQQTIPRISLGTVYRNLQVLVDEGMALRLATKSGSHRFDGDTSPHHHGWCRHCGRVLDVNLPEDPEWLADVERESGLAVEAWHITFEGVCAECVNR